MLAFGAASGVARAQYNPDGTPSMIPPNGDVFGASAVSPPVPPPVPPPTYDGAAPIYQEGADGLPTENFDIDCDPDIQNCVDPNADSQYDDGYDPNAYQQFEAALSPYGQWNDDPDYGEVWTPSADVVGNDFEPYGSDGQWMASSDYGFTWVSDYDWGWAPFHYGRWVLGAMGWAWVPGTLWGPAWVDWRYGNGYAGWSPMPPRGVVVGKPSRSLAPTHPVWRFTLASEVTRRNPTYVPSQVVASIFKRTLPVNNARTVTTNGVAARIPIGPPVNQLSHDIGHVVPTLSLRTSAPSVLPRSSIVPKAGIALPDRIYVQRATHPNSVTAARPAVAGRSSTAPRAYGNQNTVRSNTNGVVRSYNNENYSNSVRSYSNYTPPAASQTMTTRGAAPRTYSAPEETYHAPEQTYHAPEQTYRQPEPVYRQPEPRPEPVYHQPVAAPPRAAPVFQSTGVHRR